MRVAARQALQKAMLVSRVKVDNPKRNDDSVAVKVFRYQVDRTTGELYRVKIPKHSGFKTPDFGTIPVVHDDTEIPYTGRIQAAVLSIEEQLRSGAIDNSNGFYPQDPDSLGKRIDIQA